MRGPRSVLSSVLIALGVIALIALAFGLRLSWLSIRPPHHDEGVNGWFVERMRHDGYYAYDPSNYHGPAYFYVLAAGRALLGFGVTALRIPAALIGACACLLPLLLARRLGRWPALVACAVLATSPTLVYYARDAIHETLLAALGLLVACCAVRGAATGHAGWWLATGTGFAAMVATKETTIIFAGVVGLWLGAELAVESWVARHPRIFGRPLAWSWRAAMIATGVVIAMAVVHLTLFTGFFHAPGGLVATVQRSFRAYEIWRTTGESHGGHDKPWSYYLQLATRYELVLYVLAVAGAIAGRRDRVIRGFAVIGFGLLAAYSMIPYKMPWLPVGWLMLLAIPAGHGGVTIARWLRPRGAAFAVTLGLGLVVPLAITVRSSFVRPADPREALAYVHTSPDYKTWFGLIEEVGRTTGPAKLRVAVDHEAMWPLAWSLTPYHASWRVNGDEDVMIVDTRRAAALESRLTERYYRREFLVRDQVVPAMVYFLERRITRPRQLDGFVLVGPRRAVTSR